MNDTAELVRIPLVGGGEAIVDAADAEKVAGYTWRLLVGHTGRRYAYTARSVYMHRLIADTPKGMETDHINGDGLDNRRANLRVATMGQNSANTWKPKPTRGASHTSRYKGVSWDRQRGLWAAYITVNQKSRNLGRYATEEEAARVYDAAAFDAWGEFARLNLTGGAA